MTTAKISSVLPHLFLQIKIVSSSIRNKTNQKFNMTLRNQKSIPCFLFLALHIINYRKKIYSDFSNAPSSWICRHNITISSVHSMGDWYEQFSQSFKDALRKCWKKQILIQTLSASQESRWSDFKQLQNYPLGKRGAFLWCTRVAQWWRQWQSKI